MVVDCYTLPMQERFVVLAWGKALQLRRERVGLTQLDLVALKSHRANQVSLDRLAARRQAWPAQDSPVFASPLTGAPYRHQNIEHHFHAITKAAKLPRITVHGMRHTAASLMILSGETAMVVSKTLGHASVAITVNLYSHLFEEQRKQVAESMDRLPGGAGAGL